MKYNQSMAYAIMCLLLLSAWGYSKEEIKTLKIETYLEEKIVPHLSLLNAWVQRDYVQYPYLWAPDNQEWGTDLFIKEKKTLVTLAKRDGEVIGIAAGLPFDSHALQTYFPESLIRQLNQQGYDPSQILYISIFLTAPKWRNNREVVEAIYNTYAAYAKALGKTKICYYEDVGIREEHPLKPEPFIPIEPWGYALHGFKSMGIKLNFPWMTLQVDGSAKEETHCVEFFIKDL